MASVIVSGKSIYMSSSSLLYKDNFPSEKAPAPEKPLVILQKGLHFTQFPVFSIGHILSSTLQKVLPLHHMYH